MGTPFGWDEWGRKIKAHAGTIIYVGATAVATITALGLAVTGTFSTTGNVTTQGTIIVTPGSTATGFDGRPAVTYDGAPGACWDASPVDGGAAAGCIDAGPSNTYDAGPAPTPVVVAGSVSMLESAWDIDDKVARTIGWRLRTEGAAGDSSNAPATKLLIQSTADNSTWTTRATLDMAGALADLASVTVTGRVYAAVGSAAAPAYTAAGATQSGMYFAGALLGLAVNGIAAITANSSQNVTVLGDLAVNGEDITCDSASAATVFNANATSVAIGGAGDVLMSGGSGSTGCTVTGATGALTCSGDIEAAGGYRSVISSATGIFAAGATGVATLTGGLPRAGSITGLAVRENTHSTLTAGTVTCKVFTDAYAGTAISGHDLVITPDTTYGAASMTIPKDEHPFAANKIMTVGCTGSADMAPTPLLYRVTLEIEE